MQSFPLPSVFEALHLVMRNFPDQFTEESKLEVEALLEHCLHGLEKSSEKFLGTLFIKAIRKHIGPSVSDENIYLRAFEVPQIELFNFLIKEFPFVREAQSLVNRSIAQLARGHKEVLVLDIGIGLGVQMQHLLKELAAVDSLQRVVLVGIEPFKDALDECARQLENGSYPFLFEFHPLCAFVEQFDFVLLKPLREAVSGPLIVNESLALHHIKFLADRHKVIQKVRALDPLAFFLTEPNVDHYEPDFVRRFQNCYNHFFHIFQVIDQLPAGSREKNGLKLFFGREIEDIIGGKDFDRSEKHEPAFRWVEKLKVAGFSMVNRYVGLPDELGCGIDVRYNPLVEGIDFKVGNETVVSILQAACAQE